MTTERPATEPGDAEQTLLILGATGDLAARLLLPGLGRRRPQRPAGPAGPRGPGVPGRPLPGHVDGAEHHRAAFVNRMLESVLNGEHVHSIDIIFDEALALGGRAGYYDGAGALVDMIQSHSLQVLALLAMDAPSTLQARDVRDAKAAVLRALLG